MNAIDDIKSLAATIDAELKEKKGVWTMKAVIAERKAFLSKKKLEYIARFHIDDENLFGQQYDYRFVFKEIRGSLEKIAAANGFSLDYRISPTGI